MVVDSKKEPTNNPLPGAGNATPKKGAVGNAIMLDAENPLPIEFNSGLFVNLKGKKYIPFLNPKDIFFQFLTEAKLLSPTTLSCVSSKARFCAGKGFSFKDKAEDQAFTDWAKNVNRKNESLHEIIHNAFENKFSVGNSFIQVVKGQVGGKRFVRVYLREYIDCRLGMPDDDDICNTVFISKYFRKQGLWNINAMKSEEIPIFSPNIFDRPWIPDEKGFQHTIFHLKNYTGGYEYYGMPSNIASIPEQILEYKAARYNLDSFENNMVIGGIVCLKGAMTEEEANKIGKNLVYSHTGDGKKGRWLIMHSETGMPEGIHVENFTKQEEGSFIESDQHNEEKIYIANKWNKLLIGGSESKNIGSGNSSYIRGVFDIANETVIVPEQQYMLDKFLSPLMQICDDWMNTKWSKNELQIKEMRPVSFLGDIDVNAVLTKNEGRQIIGNDPLPGKEGEEFIKAAPLKDNLNPNPDVPNK